MFAVLHCSRSSAPVLSILKPWGRIRWRASAPQYASGVVMTTVAQHTITGLAARAVGVTKAYGTGATAVTALDDISVDIRRGRFTAIMGPSGSGKSTLMHALAGLDTVDSGEVWIGETQLNTLSDKRPRGPAAQPGRVRLPAVQPAADADRRGEHHAAAGDRQAQAGPGVVRPGRGGRRARRPADPPAERAVRRAAAAGRVRAGAAAQAGRDLRRRADRQPGLPFQQRDPALPAPLGRRVQPDHRDGHPRRRAPRPTRTGWCSCWTASWCTSCSSRTPTRCWTP